MSATSWGQLDKAVVQSWTLLTDAVEDTENCAFNRLPSPATSKLQEPDYVAALVVHGTPILQNKWNAILSPQGVSVQAAGVYCHQKPIIQENCPSPPRGCEVGDLLIVHIHTPLSGDRLLNALLLQAKLSSLGYPYLIGQNDPQIRLYSMWPEFKYVRGGPPGGGVRRVTPATRHSGGQYLFIDSSAIPLGSGPALSDPCSVAMPSTEMYPYATLSAALTGMLQNHFGRPFDDKISLQPNDVGWSRFIWDLIDCLATAHFNRRGVGFVNEPRAPVPLASVISGDAGALRTAFGEDWTPPEEPPTEGDEDAIGVSTLIVSTHTTREE